MFEVFPNLGGCGEPQVFLLFRVGFRQLGKVAFADVPNRYTDLLVFLLKVGGELLVGLISDDGELGNGTIRYTLAVLVHRKPQPTPNRLAALGLGSHFTQGANLKYVRIVPTFAQRGVGKDEPNGFVFAQQPGLVLHDEVVGVIILGCDT
ncbi:hypothetical protein FRC0024_02433 [Corynebacterium diphtheriae]|nr:hypothetical protein FRC0024_02433 [Corynebacterium diphtheriae]